MATEFQLASDSHAYEATFQGHPVTLLYVSKESPWRQGHGWYVRLNAVSRNWRLVRGTESFGCSGLEEAKKLLPTRIQAEAESEYRRLTEYEKALQNGFQWNEKREALLFAGAIGRTIRLSRWSGADLYAPSGPWRLDADFLRIRGAKLRAGGTRDAQVEAQRVILREIQNRKGFLRFFLG